jgi:hypothetical protein
METDQFINPKFLEENDLLCGICKLALVEPHTILATNHEECQHTFCKDCLTQWKQQSSQCPLCRAHINSSFGDLKIKRQLAKLEVKCERASAGCNVQGLLGIGKDYFPLKHEKECGHLVIQCLDCEEKLMRKDMETHRTSCAVDCPFLSFGCVANLSKKKMEAHIRDSDRDHLILVLQAAQKSHLKDEDVNQVLRILSPLENAMEEKSVAILEVDEPWDPYTVKVGDFVEYLDAESQYVEAKVLELNSPVSVRISSKDSPSEWVEYRSLERIFTHTGLEVLFIFSSGRVRSFKLKHSILRHNLSDLKQRLHEHSGVSVSRIIVGEVWKGRIYRFLVSEKPEVHRNDIIIAWEDSSEVDDLKSFGDCGYGQIIPVTVLEEISWMGGKNLVPTHCGLPLVFTLSKGSAWSGRELEEKIRRLMKPWIKNDANFSIRKFDATFAISPIMHLAFRFGLSLPRLPQCWNPPRISTVNCFQLFGIPVVNRVNENFERTFIIQVLRSTTSQLSGLAV